MSVNCPPCLEDMNRPDDSCGAGSGVVRILYGLKNDVLTWPAKKSAETRTLLSDHVNTTVSNLVMKTGKRMFEFQSKKASAELKYVGEGEEGSRSLKGSLECYHPQLRDQLLGFATATQNQELVILAKTRKGDWHMLGNADEGAVMETFDATSGKATTDPNGATLMFSQPGLNAATIYKGETESLLVVASEASPSGV